MMRVLLLAAAAMATYEECHLYRSAVIARERAPALSRRRLLPKPITKKPKPINARAREGASRARDHRSRRAALREPQRLRGLAG